LGATSYPRTKTQRDTKNQAYALRDLIRKLLSQGYLSAADLETLIRLCGELNWAIGARSYIVKALRALHDLRVKAALEEAKNRARLEDFARMLEKAGQEDRDRIQQQLDDAKKKQELFERLRLETQISTLLATDSRDIRPIHEKLNNPLPNEYPDFKPYDFKRKAETDGTAYYKDSDGTYLIEKYLDKVDASHQKTDFDGLMDEGSRARLEKEVDNLSKLDPETRNEIMEGFIKGDVHVLSDKYPELADFDKCMAVLDDMGVLVGKWKDLGRKGNHEDMFVKGGYQREHIPPLQTFHKERALGRDRTKVPLIDGIGEYDHDNAICFGIFDGQHTNEEHYITSRAQENFMKELQGEGKNATLGEWLNKSVEWNKEIFEKRAMRGETLPLSDTTKAQISVEAEKAAIAMRNVAKAHFIGIGADLNTPLENGKYRDLEPNTCTGTQDDSI
jgi:hypothetical protein